MKILSEKQLGNELVDALDDLNKIEDEQLVIDLHGQKFIVLKEENYRGLCETDYLLSSTKNTTALEIALKEPLEECSDLRDVINELDC